LLYSIVEEEDPNDSGFHGSSDASDMDISIPQDSSLDDVQGGVMKPEVRRFPWRQH
jgi:hypothetical protein